MTQSIRKKTPAGGPAANGVVDVLVPVALDHTYSYRVPRGTELNGLFAALTAAGIGVRSMRNKANRLEELFMRLLEKPPVAA